MYKTLHKCNTQNIHFMRQLTQYAIATKQNVVTIETVGKHAVFLPRWPVQNIYFLFFLIIFLFHTKMMLKFITQTLAQSFAFYNEIQHEVSDWIYKGIVYS